MIKRWPCLVVAILCLLAVAMSAPWRVGACVGAFAESSASSGLLPTESHEPSA